MANDPNAHVEKMESAVMDVRTDKDKSQMKVELKPQKVHLRTLHTPSAPPHLPPPHAAHHATPPCTTDSIASARHPGLRLTYQALDELPIAQCKGNVHDVLQHNKRPPLKKATLSKNKLSYQKKPALKGTLKWLAAFCVLGCVGAVAPVTAPDRG